MSQDKPDEPTVYEEFELPLETPPGEDGAMGPVSPLAPTLKGDRAPLDVTVVGERPLAAGAPFADELRQASERLWVASLRSPWTSLALIPAVPGVSVRSVAEALVRVGSEYRGRAVELVEAQGLAMSEARELSERVAAVRERHAFVVTLDCPLASQSALVVARAASAALLVVPVGPTPLGDARRTIESVGQPLFIGAVVLQPRPA